MWKTRQRQASQRVGSRKRWVSISADHGGGKSRWQEVNSVPTEEETEEMKQQNKGESIVFSDYM